MCYLIQRILTRGEECNRIQYRTSLAHSAPTTLVKVIKTTLKICRASISPGLSAGGKFYFFSSSKNISQNFKIFSKKIKLTFPSDVTTPFACKYFVLAQKFPIFGNEKYLFDFSSSSNIFQCGIYYLPDWCWGRRNRFYGIRIMLMSRWWWMIIICHPL